MYNIYVVVYLEQIILTGIVNFTFFSYISKKEVNYIRKNNYKLIRVRSLINRKMIFFNLSILNSET